MEIEMEEQKKVAFDKGYAKAEDDVVDQLEAAEGNFKAQQHSESYVLEYNKALDDKRVGANDERRASIEVPPLAAAEPEVADQANEETNANATPDPLAADHRHQPCLPTLKNLV